MSEVNQTRGTVRVYACGGCGVNIGSMLEPYRDELDLSVAKLDIAYIDTSTSNLSTEIPEAQRYIIGGIDGAGKVRRDGHSPIAANIPSALEKFPPADVSIILGSAAGGSGSVIGPLIASELLAQEKSVIVFCVGSADTRIDADNTLKTLKSYESVAKTRKLPLVVSYLQNSRDRPRSAVDESMRGRALELAILYSRNNRELDSRDLFNFLRFDRVTRYKDPILAALTMGNGGDDQLPEVGDIITVATLANLNDHTALDDPPEYQCVGYLPPYAAQAVRDTVPLHYYVTDGLFDTVGQELTDALKRIEAAHSKRTRRESLLKDDDQATDSGIVF